MPANRVPRASAEMCAKLAEPARAADSGLGAMQTTIRALALKLRCKEARALLHTPCCPRVEAAVVSGLH
jgi:hypothetical protein